MKAEAILAPYHLGSDIQMATNLGVVFAMTYTGPVQTTYVSHAWFAHREKAGDMGLTNRWKRLKNGDLYEFTSSDNGASVTVQTPSDQNTYIANEPPTSGGKQLFTVAQLLKITQQIADETDSMRVTNPSR